MVGVNEAHFISYVTQFKISSSSAAAAVSVYLSLSH
jgi:hypothetical protein